MSAYLEKEGISTFSVDGDPCCPGGDTDCGCTGSGSTPSTPSTSDSDFDPYAYLKDFSSWELKDKVALFCNRIEIMNMEKLPKELWEIAANERLVKVTQDTGRRMLSVKHDITSGGVLRLMFVFDSPVHNNGFQDKYPDIYQWGVNHGLV